MVKLSKTAGGTSTAASTPRRQRSLLALWLVLAVTLAPLVAAIVVYLNPQWLAGESTNYGVLLDPQVPVPEPTHLTLRDLDGQPVDLRDKRGQWLLVSVGGGACDEACVRKLFIMRQTHASLGNNIKRVQRVWLIPDDVPVPEVVLTAYEGTHMLRAPREQIEAFLGTAATENHIWVIDPLGHLMLRFPEDPDPTRLRKDLSKLLFASRVG